VASNLKKPTLAATDVAAFAKKTASSPSKSKSGQVPAGDVRLTVNIRADLHKRLRIAAINREMTAGELLEELIQTL
jgi:hypothetical protein